MNKQELIDAVAARTGDTRAATGEVIDAVPGAITRAAAARSVNALMTATYREIGRVEALLATALCSLATARVFRNVGNHAPVENGLAVGPAVVDAVQTDARAFQVHADGARHLAQSGQRVTQQGRFVAVARSGDERRDDVAATIAEGHHLVAFQMFMTAVTEIVTAFFRRRRRAIAVNDARSSN
ncbi:hypothetical protein HDG37_005487 [Paraburkholderia sp. MM5384-R2]|nr:hypothetical protein [Paraburkholderia sp. MM5384-R2]